MNTTILVNSKTRIPEKGLPRPVIDRLKARLNFENPQWEENKKRGYWQGNTEPWLHFLWREGDHLTLPRGFTKQLMNILDGHGLSYTIDDRTRKLGAVSFTFKGELYPFQQQAVEAVLGRRYGVLSSPTGSGKTNMALYVISERKQPALVIVHSKELLHQWIDRAQQFLGLERDEIGVIGDGKKVVGEHLTIAIINSLYKCASQVRGKIGFLICDECHRTPARTFTEAVGQFDCRYLLGLSATPYRRDGLTWVIHFYMGDETYRIEPKALQDIGRIMKPELVIRKTGFDYDYRDDYQAMISALVADSERNSLIVSDVLKETGNGNNGIALVLSDRKTHCDDLYDRIRGEGITVRLLTGDIANGERKEIVEELNQGTVKTLVATSQLIGEGFDLPELSSIFLATPIKFSGRVKQYVGRVLRVASDKPQAKIYDYVDKRGCYGPGLRRGVWLIWMWGLKPFLSFLVFVSLESVFLKTVAL